MKRRPIVLKIAAVAFSVVLVGAYVFARAAGWIGEEAQPAATPVVSTGATQSPAVQSAEPVNPPSTEYFSGSKSAPVLRPAQTPKVMPSSKSGRIEPLPTYQFPTTAKPEEKPKQPAQPSPK